VSRLARLRIFIDGMAPRERILLLTAVTAALVLGAYQFLLEPVYTHIRTLHARLETLQAQRLGVSQEIAELSATAPGAAGSVQRQIQQAREDLVHMKEELKASGRRYLPPQELYRWLADLLNERAAEGLEVVWIQSLPAEQVYPPPPGTAAPAAPPSAGPGSLKLYRKGVELRFRGDYPATLHYFKSLQEKDVPVLWGAFDYRVLHYPTAETSVVAYTYIVGPDFPGEGSVRGAPGSTLGTLESWVDPGFAAANARSNDAARQARRSVQTSP
jgi:Type II secretion system (T2SS), protein M